MVDFGYWIATSILLDEVLMLYKCAKIWIFLKGGILAEYFGIFG